MPQPPPEPELAAPPSPESPTLRSRVLRLPVAAGLALTVLLLGLLVASQSHCLRLGGGKEGGWGADLRCLHGMLVMGAGPGWTSWNYTPIPSSPIERHWLVESQILADTYYGAALFGHTPWHGEFRRDLVYLDPPILNSTGRLVEAPLLAVPLVALLPLAWLWPLARWMRLRDWNREGSQAPPSSPGVGLGLGHGPVRRVTLFFGTVTSGVVLWALAAGLTPEPVPEAALLRLGDTEAEALARSGGRGAKTSPAPGGSPFGPAHAYVWRERGYWVEPHFVPGMDGLLRCHRVRYGCLGIEKGGSSWRDRLLALNASPTSPWRRKGTTHGTGTEWETVDRRRMARQSGQSHFEMFYTDSLNRGAPRSLFKGGDP